MGVGALVGTPSVTAVHGNSDATRRRSISALWVAAVRVTVGGAYGSSNERAQTHRRFLL